MKKSYVRQVPKITGKGGRTEYDSNFSRTIPIYTIPAEELRATRECTPAEAEAFERECREAAEKAKRLQNSPERQFGSLKNLIISCEQNLAQKNLPSKPPVFILKDKQWADGNTPVVQKMLAIEAEQNSIYEQGTDREVDALIRNEIDNYDFIGSALEALGIEARSAEWHIGMAHQWASMALRGLESAENQRELISEGVKLAMYAQAYFEKGIFQLRGLDLAACVGQKALNSKGRERHLIHEHKEEFARRCQQYKNTHPKKNKKQVSEEVAQDMKSQHDWPEPPTYETLKNFWEAKK